MDLPLPPLHPRLPELLQHLNLRLVDAIKWNVLLCVPADSDGKTGTVILKFGSDRRKAESLAYEARVLRDVLPGLDDEGFERLVLPEYLEDGVYEGVQWMKSSFIPGKPLVHEWSEMNFKPDILGGKGMSKEVAVIAVDVLRDLRLVDTSALPTFVRHFSFDEWLSGFRLKSETMIGQGLISREVVEKAMSFFTTKNASRYEGTMFTNGDFYPRNFVLLPEGRVAITDWVGGVDPWSFVAAYAWLLMWGNAEWQETYAAAVASHFPVDMDEMQVGLLVKSFEQAYRWRDLPPEHISVARNRMLDYFTEFLDVEKVRRIFTVRADETCG